MPELAAAGWLGWDWGSVPAWASAILTSGSLSLGFFILLRDRRKEERAVASLVTCWRTWSSDLYITHVHNASKRTVVDVAILVRLPELGPRGEFQYETFGLAGVIRPEGEATCETPRGGLGKRMPPQFVTFQDADGIFWIRALQSWPPTSPPSYYHRLIVDGRRR